jgi:DNA repair protein RecO (recombination protein O)
MLQKTKGILIKNTKYGETSLISKIYTRQLGLQSYMVNGVRKKKPRVSPALLQPASLLEMVVYHKDRKQIQRPAELKPAHTYDQLPFHVLKSSIAQYILEVLYKSIHGEQESPRLFDFLYHALKHLDQQPQLIPHFHLFVLIKLTKHLGFAPSGRHSSNQPIFDLKAGVFREAAPAHAQYLSPQNSKQFSRLASAKLSELEGIELSLSERRELTGQVEQYYRYHILGNSFLKTPSVLKEVLA